jgi:hypothetical protein
MVDVIDALKDLDTFAEKLTLSLPVRENESVREGDTETLRLPDVETFRDVVVLWEAETLVDICRVGETLKVNDPLTDVVNDDGREEDVEFRVERLPVTCDVSDDVDDVLTEDVGV